MKEMFIFLLLAAMNCQSTTAKLVSDNDKLKVLEEWCITLQAKQTCLENELNKLSKKQNGSNCIVQTLSKENKEQTILIDSLQKICKQLEDTQSIDRRDVNSKMQKANNILVSIQSVVENRTFWGGIITIVILFIMLLISYYLTKRIKRGTSSIDEMRMAQDALQKAYVKMQEESAKLDNKIIELCEQQIKLTPAKTQNTQTDHSLALKVADEIVRIEMNLSRMDASVKGYKQLTKAVQRIKDNFNANGYEIVDMLGKTYNAGMKAAVTFITDESLEPGQQIITKIIKPQINYQQQMIQAAQIEVSQPE